MGISAPRHTAWRRGTVNPLLAMLAVTCFAVAALGMYLMIDSGRGPGHDRRASSLSFYCAAGMRAPISRIAQEYEEEFGVSIQIQYGGSNTLLSQIEVAQTGDLYLAADESYLKQARDRGLVEERLPVARMRPIIAVPKGNPQQIRSIDDLLRDGVRVAMGNPDQTAIGKRTRHALGESGQWEPLEARVQEKGVFLPTVNEVANVVKLGSVDAGIIWDAVAAQYDEIDAEVCPELETAETRIELGVFA